MAEIIEFNGKSYKHEDFANMTIEQIDTLLKDTVECMHEVASKKRNLQALPYGKKNSKTWAKVVKLKTRLEELQYLQAELNFVKKQKNAERNIADKFYRNFFLVCQKKLRKSLFSKIAEEAKNEAIA